ncbi:outer membrane biogenesis protein BamB [Stratiformator vulcanicus]|uniref:Outer membrane biogenesis protein BamB n=2 Tax=Stratiformator vulcanicus TaxID=2527980 RepID=A0A517R2S8_9PLAN|nr:outer membrane biogenesis protein BamB [Stratiformator vulcanicus]
MFRGGDGNGLVESANLPVDINADSDVVWRTPVHGRGWSSPVVLEGTIWLTTATEDGRSMSVLAIDATDGTVIHDRVVFENESPNFSHPTNTYASCSPVVESGRVYVHFGRYGTACLDSKSAETLWERRDILYDDFRGPASSPILQDGRLYFSCDGVDVQYVICLDARTGETAWKVDRRIDYESDNPDRYKAYSTPAIFEVDGRLQLVSPAAMETVAYDPKSGDELWRVRHGGMNAGLRPVMAKGLIMVTAGDGGTSLVAIDPTEIDSDGYAKVVWSNGRMVPKRSSPIVVGELLLMVSDDGIVTCRDVISGEEFWKERIRDDFWSSPVSDGERVLLCGKDGTVAVVAAEREYELLSKTQFPEGFNATPAIADGAIFLRSISHLYRINQATE